MGWYALLQAALVVVLVVAQLPSLRRQWLETPDESARGLRIAAYYLAFIGVGMLILISSLVNAASHQHALIAGIVFFLGWVVLGISWIIKVAPKPATPQTPRIVQPLNALDIVAIVTIAVSLPYLLVL